MKRVAAAVENGQSLEQALSAESGRLPSDLGALVSAGVRTGDLGRVLSDYVRLRRELDDVHRKVRLAIAYPGFLVLAVAALCIFFFVIVIPAMASLVRTINSHQFDSSSKAIPPVLRTGVEVSEWLARNSEAMAIGAGAVVAILLLAAMIAGPRRRRQAVKCLPLFGPLWRYSGLTEAAELLRTLLENDVPLPEALRLTADGIRDADLADSLCHVAAHVAAGDPLSVALKSSSQFPPFWQPVLAWGEAHSSLPAALETVTQATTRRLDQRGVDFSDRSSRRFLIHCRDCPVCHELRGSVAAICLRLGDVFPEKLVIERLLRLNGRRRAYRARRACWSLAERFLLRFDSSIPSERRERMVSKSPCGWEAGCWWRLEFSAS